MIDFTAVESIFFAALDKPAGPERAAFLAQACADDDLRKHVERMLAAHPQVGNFIESPVQVATVDETPVKERPGTVIGPYRLMEQIGEGGFGLVFVAEQLHPVRRKVALKIIKPGMDTRDVIARFEAERQALALMDHPHIAKVFDAGETESGRPFFVMELVKGVSIVDYCDGQQLTARERLDLFLSVCQAVQHAHGRGVIHRDLQPSNILVASHDGVPVVKVIDFGVAKAVGQQLTDKTIYTRFAQMIGTPLYMSPEQAEFSALDVDIRSDVYSLGVLLYELLTGTTPFDRKRFAKAAYDEIRRIIKEEEPPRPSTRLSTMGDLLSKVSIQRKTEPARLSALVRGELDWIVMRCLEKDRNRRYETASSLAKDLQRYLNDEPVEACPPSARYRMSKFIRRYRATLAVASSFAALLLIAAVVSTWQALRAFRAEALAQSNADRATQSEQIAQQKRQEADEAKQHAERRSEELRKLVYTADMNLARHAWDENKRTLFKELLDRHIPEPGEVDQRGFEWRFLRRLGHGYLFTIKAHDGWVRSVEWTPDAKRFVSVAVLGYDLTKGAGEIKLWDVGTRQRIPLSFKGPMEKVYCGALSPDGKLIAAGCRDKVVRIWNLETGEIDAVLEARKFEVCPQVVYSRDGKHVAALFWQDNQSELQEIVVWNVETRKVVIAVDATFPTLIHQLAFSPDGKRLAAGIGGELLVSWDVSSGTELFRKNIGMDAKSVAFSLDGKQLLVAGFTGDIQLLNAANGALVKTFRAPNGTRFTLAVSPDGKRFTAGTVPGVELWDIDAGVLIRVFKSADSAGIHNSPFSPDGTRLATAGRDGNVSIWDALRDRDRIDLPTESLVIGLSPNGELAATAEHAKPFGLWKTGRGSKSLQLWNVQTGSPVGDHLSLDDSIHGVAFTRDGSRVVATDFGGTVYVLDTANGKLLSRFKPDDLQGAVPQAESKGRWLSLNGKWLLRSSAHGLLKIWDAEKGAAIHEFNGLGEGLGYVLSSNKNRIAVYDLDENQPIVRIIDPYTRAELWRFKMQSLIYSIRLNAEATRMVVSLRSEVHIFDVNSGQEVGPPLKGQRADNMAFSPDGTRIATSHGYNNEKVTVWDVSTGAQMLSLDVRADDAVYLAFTPDGNRLITAGDHTINIWDATPLEE